MISEQLAVDVRKIMTMLVEMKGTNSTTENQIPLPHFTNVEEVLQYSPDEETTKRLVSIPNDN